MLGYTTYRDWPPGGLNQQQHLSVVTTVWGITTSTPSTPLDAYAGAPSLGKGHVNAAYANQGNFKGHGVNNYGPCLNGMNHPDGGGGYTNQGNALTTAAMVAAATATATATASVVAFQDQSMQFGNQPYVHGYQRMMPMNPMVMNQMGGAMHPMGGGKFPGGPTPPNAMYQSRRMSPYPSPAMHMTQKRAGPHYTSPIMSPVQGKSGAPNMVQMGPSSGPSMGPAPNYTSNQYASYPTRQPGFNQYPAQQPLGPSNNFPGNGNMGPTRQMRGNAAPYNNPAPYFQGQMTQFPANSQQFAGHMQTVPAQYSPSGQFQQDVVGRGNLNYQHSPIPGNPTPPLTPASSIPSYASPTPDVKPNFNEIKSPQPQKDDELRLTFPVRDGIILPPFRLEHNLAVSNHVFQLKPTVHQTLMWRSDLELQLKCFHHEDRNMNTNWPTSVQVSVNATPLVIDRGENKTSHKPLYLKDVCQPGRNTIQITVAACCCSHLFVLQLVHRPSVRSVLQGLLRKRLLMAEHCISKIKRNFSSSGSSDRDAVEQTGLKVSLKCPITFKRITLPARGHECKHIQCFDLESYLQLHCERGSWRCPVCNKPAQLEGLEVDQYMWGILNSLTANDVEEVTIDSQANWKPARNGIKLEDDGGDSCSKRLNKPVSPGSMTLPTMNNWDIGQAMSPYLPPDMNTIASGSMIGGAARVLGGSVDGGGMGPLGGAGDYLGGGGPLSHLTDTVNTLDPLNAIEKSLNEQMPHTPQTPHTPHTPSGGTTGPPSVSPSMSDHVTGGAPTANCDGADKVPDLPGDLNFDPAAVIAGEGAGQEALNLLPDTVVDPMELLSYLDPPDLSTPPSSGGSGAPPNGAPANDDILALFE